MISVIIPCFNHGHYLGFALDSILAQTYGDWEAIVVDDGSTDETGKVAGRYKDPRIHYIYQENQGLSAARNKGIQHAGGEYLAFLDADDEWEPTFLGTTLARFSQDDRLTAVFTRTRFIDPGGRVLPATGGFAVPASAFRQRILEGGFFPVHAILVKTEMVLKAGLFDPGLTSLEDWDLWLRLSKDGLFEGIEPVLARYRVYPGSMSTNAARMHANRQAILEKNFGHLPADMNVAAGDQRMVYGHAYRLSAFSYLQQDEPEEGWRLLKRSVEIWPPLLERLDTFYELAFGNQKMGYRGQAELLDLQANGKALMAGLDCLFADAARPVASRRGIAYANAHLALAMLADQAGQWGFARNNMFNSFIKRPGQLASSGFVRRLLKLFLGRRLVRHSSAKRPGHSGQNFLLEEPGRRLQKVNHPNKSSDSG